jgi:hypothetical protein
VSVRGGYRRRRFVLPGQVPIWIASGRWGPRRVRVGECAAVLPAELVYHRLICDRARFGAGSRGTATWTPNESGPSWTINTEVLANAVWRRGRLFLRCPACAKLHAFTCRRRVLSLAAGVVGVSVMKASPGATNRSTWGDWSSRLLPTARRMRDGSNDAQPRGPDTLSGACCFQGRPRGRRDARLGLDGSSYRGH